MKIKMNKHYDDLPKEYLFREIGERARVYSERFPYIPVINLGIGDVSLPLSAYVTEAMVKACIEQGKEETFHGYGPVNGYAFLREAISVYYESFNCYLNPDDIFISDGAKNDVANITEIFGDNPIYIQSPVYPVYYESNVMCGRFPEYMEGTVENGFLPMPMKHYKTGIYYLCSPNNPTGAVYSKEQLKEWVDFALKTDSLIIFDSSYECFIQDDLPHSVYETEGAVRCCIEIGSFSKSAGFTGTRCSYTVIPSALESDGYSLKEIWQRRQSSKTNGVAYVVQKGAEASLSETGLEEREKTIRYYRENAEILCNLFAKKGCFFTGGRNSPYIWVKCPYNFDSRKMFDVLLNNEGIIGTPGSGFGKGGEYFFRFSSFASRKNIIDACEKIDLLL